MAYTTSTTRLPHAGLYDYDGRQIELDHMKWFKCRYSNRAQVHVFMKCLRLVQTFLWTHKHPSCNI